MSAIGKSAPRIEIFASLSVAEKKGVSPAFHRLFEKKAVQKDRPHTITYFKESLVLLEGGGLNLEK